MTQFLSLRQIFENFFDPSDLFKILFTDLSSFLAKVEMCAAKPSIVTQFFGLWPSI
jgi:hypothetical protein